MVMIKKGRCSSCGRIISESFALNCTECGEAFENGTMMVDPHKKGDRYEPVSGVPFQFKGLNLLPGDEISCMLKGGRRVQGEVDLASSKMILYMNRPHPEGHWPRIQFTPEECESIEILSMSERVIRERPSSSSPILQGLIERGERQSDGSILVDASSSAHVLFNYSPLEENYMYRVEEKKVFILEPATGRLIVTENPVSYLRFDPRKPIRGQANSFVSLAERGDGYQVYSTPGMVRTQGRGRPGAPRAVVGGFRFQVGGKKARERQAKDRDKQIMAKRVSKRNIAKRIAAAKKWHQSAQGRRMHRAQGRYNKQKKAYRLDRQEMEERAFSNGLDYFFGDMVMWAMNENLEIVKTAIPSELLSFVFRLNEGWTYYIFPNATVGRKVEAFLKQRRIKFEYGDEANELLIDTTMIPPDVTKDLEKKFRGIVEPSGSFESVEESEIGESKVKELAARTISKVARILHKDEEELWEELMHEPMIFMNKYGQYMGPAIKQLISMV